MVRLLLFLNFQLRGGTGKLFAELLNRQRVFYAEMANPGASQCNQASSVIEGFAKIMDQTADIGAF